MNASFCKCPNCGEQHAVRARKKKTLQRAWKVYIEAGNKPPAFYWEWCGRCVYRHFKSVKVQFELKKPDDGGRELRAGENQASLGPFRFGTGGGRRVIRSSKGLY